MLAFSATLLVGLFSGTAPAKLIPQAVISMGGGFLLGAVAAWIGIHIIRDGIEKSSEESEANQPTGDDDGADVTVVGG